MFKFFRKNSIENIEENTDNKNTNQLNKDKVFELENNFQEKTENKKIGIIESFINKNKVSLVSKNRIEDEEENILKEFSKIEAIESPIYYVAGFSSKNIENIVLYKYNENDDEILTIDKNILPENFYINSILRFIDNKYVLDEKASELIEKKIREMLDNIIKEQQEELELYKKEGHFYKVEEDTNSRIYLFDITDNPDFSIEEVDFPEELLDLAKEGTFFQYKSGKYNYIGNNLDDIT